MLTMLITVIGCATDHCRNNKINLPQIPTAGPKVADELDQFCLPDKGQCKNLNEWLNDLYLFKIKYTVISNYQK